MKLTIEINAKEFERLNYTMSQLADILSGNNFLQNKLDLKQKDTENLEKFRNKLTKEFLKTISQ